MLCLLVTMFWDMETAVFEDLSIYLKSLRQMQSIFRCRGYPGHGPLIEDGPERILEYIQHRQDREDEVMAVLKPPNLASDIMQKGGECGYDEWSSMEIVKIVYRDVPASLHMAADGDVVQVLH